MQQRLQEIIAITPFECPDAALTLAACRAGALGVLDTGRDAPAAHAAIARLAVLPADSAGLRVPANIAIDARTLPASIGTIVVDAGTSLDAWAGRRVLVQVTSLAQARAAAAAGAAGLIAKGHESGGRIGGDTSFVLLQALVDAVALPVWVQGGVGLHTAAACIAGGATGVVLDAQLALLRESTLAPDVKAAVAAMDGSETAIVAGHRVYTRPDLPVRALAAAGDVRALLGGRDLHDRTAARRPGRGVRQAARRALPHRRRRRARTARGDRARRRRRASPAGARVRVHRWRRTSAPGIRSSRAR